jgi:abelson tyrosine-protein kinase 1
VARPPFSRIAADIKQIRAKIGGTFDEPTLPPPETIIEEPSNHRSPSTLPIELPEDPTAPPANGGLPRSSVKWPNTVQILPPSTTQPVKSTESPFSRQGSIVLEDAISSDNSSDAGLPIDIDASGYLSPPPENSNMIMTRDERRYRLLLQHEFHPTRA